jgi:hypothetical protein
MTYEEFELIFVMLECEKKTQDDFINSLPASIADAFFENEYVGSLERQISSMMEILFPDKDLLEAVYNLMYGAFFGMSDETTVLETLEDKLAHFKKVYFS